MIKDSLKISDEQAEAIERLAEYFGYYTKVTGLGIRTMFKLYTMEIVVDDVIIGELESRGIVYVDWCDGSINFYIQHEMFLR